MIKMNIKMVWLYISLGFHVIGFIVGMILLDKEIHE